jgi:hypothetical protein
MCIESSPVIWTPPRWLLQQIIVSSFAPQHFHLGVQSPIICYNKSVSSKSSVGRRHEENIAKTDPPRPPRIYAKGQANTE